MNNQNDDILQDIFEQEDVLISPETEELDLFLSDSTRKKTFLRCPHCEEGEMIAVPKMPVCLCSTCNFSMSRQDVKSEMIRNLNEISNLIKK